MKQHIRIKFVDFWDDFVPENNIFYQLLAERYDVELCEKPDYLFYSVFGEEYLNYDCNARPKPSLHIHRQTTLPKKELRPFEVYYQPRPYSKYR